MSTITIEKNLDDLTMVVSTRFDKPVQRVWQLWSDPRQLERWWGPPTYPATVVEHDLVAGGWVHYVMTGPEGDRSAGAWRVVAVDPPHALHVVDVFTDENGTPDEEMPATTMRVALSADGAGTRMSITSTFPSRQAMEQLIAMGMEDGIRAAAGQIDGVLAD